MNDLNYHTEKHTITSNKNENNISQNFVIGF